LLSCYTVFGCLTHRDEANKGDYTVTPTPAQVFFNEASEWERQFRDAIQANELITAWEACEYVEMYCRLTEAAAALQQQATMADALARIAAHMEDWHLMERLNTY
jgi:long-subunit acyl-CoA synthetase (AMP-forming)